jgi:2-dehydro-3-deoxyphosphooctonate aldolase (KDO 8-P synthase)
MARSLKEIAERTGIHFLFKASFDKANRTSVDSFRGPGIHEGCRILGEISKELDIPVTTDIHTAEQADIAAEHIDLLQIPSFLCRQTDMLEAAAKTGRAVNVKKGQFLAPWDTVNIAGKMRAFGCERFLITERGTTFGYNNLVADMRSLYWIRKEGLPVVFDATHSVQRPGGLGGTTGGDGELAPVLARAAIATGVDGCSWKSTRIRPTRFPTARTRSRSNSSRTCSSNSSPSTTRRTERPKTPASLRAILPALLLLLPAVPRRRKRGCPKEEKSPPFPCCPMAANSKA